MMRRNGERWEMERRGEFLSCSIKFGEVLWMYTRLVVAMRLA